MIMHTPILLITFNRTEHTRRVLEAILASGVQDLYVFQDAPREGRPDDVEKCAAVRQVIDSFVLCPSAQRSNVRLHTFYADSNMGCGPGPAAAISWFFNNVEQGIVMEDDCLPHPDFFPYCEELLEQYKDNPQVAFINATLYNGRHENWQIGDSYGFSRYMVTGAWAGWRRTWQGFDLDLHSMNAWRFRNDLCKLLDNPTEADWWYFRVLETQQDTEKKSYWDYQMQIHLFRNKAVTIHPCVNLISNIGFCGEATHTFTNDDARGDRPVFPIMPLVHPAHIAVDKELDARCFAKVEPLSLRKRIPAFIYKRMLYSTGLAHRLLMAYKRIKHGK